MNFYEHTRHFWNAWMRFLILGMTYCLVGSARRRRRQRARRRPTPGARDAHAKLIERSCGRVHASDSSCVYMVFVVSLKQSTEHKKDITQEAGTHASRGTSRGTGFELIVPLRSGPGTGSRSTMTRSTRQPYIAPRPSQS